jgi:protein-S-isoprenylcysteine O-methyltransferase Ste14
MDPVSSLNPVSLVAGTTLIVLFSWFLSIKHGRYHGIARFFSFESIYIMVLLNTGVWFREPFSPFQLISWFLLALSVWFAIAGFILLKRMGKPQGGNFENTSVIVKTGLYKYIRHPLYQSLLIGGTGVMMKKPEATQLMLGALNLFAIWFTARIEENEMITRFGEEYRTYMRETKMFIPFIL